MIDETDFAPKCYPKDKDNKFTVRVDKTGRVEIPKAIMRELRIRYCDKLEMVVENGAIVIRQI